MASVLTLLIAVRLCKKELISFHFDDAGMFYRYAWNLRHGFGMSWNAGEGPVFGLTSVPWVFVVLFGSLFSSNPIHILVVLSFTTGMAALGIAAWLASRRASSRLLRNVFVVFPAMSLPLLLHPWFQTTLGNGMETMLAFLTLTVFLESVRRFADTPTKTHAITTAAFGTVCILTRPELLICVVLVPFLTWWLTLRWVAFDEFKWFYGTLFCLLAADIVLNNAYFGTPVPLAFYVKSFGTYYDGYRPAINALGYASMFLSITGPFLLISALTARKQDRLMLAVYIVPAVVTSIYLSTVNQIMGWRGRYYIPLLAMILMPAFITADRALSRGEVLTWSRSRIVAVAIAFLLASPVTERIYGPLGLRVSTARHIYLPPHFQYSAHGRLPSLDWYESCKSFLQVVEPLPKRVVISASEVGLLGAELPKVSIIDSAGLNDTTLALRGFSVDYLLSRHPDVIWLPHPDYSRLYGRIASDPRLLEQYDLYAGVFNHGVAVRKKSPLYPEIMAALQRVFASTYPDYVLEDYKVGSVTWASDKTRSGTAEDSVMP